jgi:hypothetical protein
MTGFRASALATTTVSLMLLLVAGVGVGAHRDPAQPPTSLDYWRPSPEDVEKLVGISVTRVEALPDPDSRADLVAIFIRHNQAAAALDRAEYKQGLILLERELSSLAGKFLQAHGTEGYLALGGYLAEQLHRSLVEVAQAQYESGLPLQDWLHQTPESAALQRIRALSGRFLERAVNAGLLGHQQRPDRDRLLVARTLWMERWAILAGLLPEAVLSPVETRLTLLWKIEAAEHLGGSRRTQLLAVAAARLPGYPAPYVEGVLRARQGDMEGALESFLNCLEERVEVELSRAWVLSLRRFAWDELL